MHTRIPFELTTAQGVARFRSFLLRAADLAVSHGGSLSGEHGDGQARGELLPRMFGERLMAAFGEFKAAFDPGDRKWTVGYQLPAPRAVEIAAR
ncbi:FAD-linked oxidase C-terminal domain-containing protein [Streptomyces sp. NRRL B-24720]|uniref:FAD-binding oxidoreductase n=1 Tax=Streptomyces sp. NRRL B-24720 TaxID=1476876 RepID=UPI0004C53255